MKEAKQTCYRMMVFVVITGIVFAVAGALISRQYIMFPVSVMAGCLVSIGLIFHMLRCATAIIRMSEPKAKSYGRSMSVLRISMMGLALLVACYYNEYVNPWGVLLGLLSLKFAAYLSQFIRIGKKDKGEENDNGNAGSAEYIGKKA